MARGKIGLGRGLDSLFSDDSPIEEITESTVESVPDDKVETLRISQIQPNKNQPRRHFDKEKLDELADSIKQHGLIQPIVVVKDNDMYTIVAGERRWRASKKAGLKEVPVIIHEYTAAQIAQISLIENLQRENLNPIEEAGGYRVLIDEYNMTQDELSSCIGKSRSAIANSLRLLSLEKDIQDKLISGEISSGHARALLSVENPEMRMALLNSILEKKLNVRQAEALAKQLQKSKPPKKKALDEQVLEALNTIETKLSSQLGTKVKLIHGEKKGKIEIEYFGNADLERILSLLG